MTAFGTSYHYFLLEKGCTLYAPQSTPFRVGYAPAHEPVVPESRTLLPPCLCGARVYVLSVCVLAYQTSRTLKTFFFPVQDNVRTGQ